MMRKPLRTAFLVLISVGLPACGGAHHPFPGSYPDAEYTNGHALVVNEVTSDMAALEETLVSITNQKRVSLGLKSLLRNASLDGISRGHGVHMMQHAFYGHVNPEGFDQTGRVAMITSAPVSVGENLWVVEPFRDAQYVFDGFWNSPDHQANLIGDFDLIGVGFFVATEGLYLGDHFVVMDFVKLY